MNLSKESKEKIKSTILSYCEGIEHVEFNVRDLDSMVAGIEAVIEEEKEDLRRLPEDPVLTATSPKLRALSPKVGQYIRVYAHELQRSELMEVFDVRGNHICCGYEGIEYSVGLQPIGNGEARWEGHCN